jgi:hypothetical protein
MKKLVIVIALLLTVSLGSAYNMSSFDSSEMEDYESMVNDRTEDAPPLFSSIIGNQTINVIIEREGSNTTAGAKIEGLVLANIKNSAYENATIEVVTDQETFENIASSDNPLDTAIEEFNEGDITYSAKGFWNKLKLAIIEPFITG